MTRVDKKIRTMIYNRKDRSLIKHKPQLLKRSIRKFDETNWWEWGRKYHKRSGPRIYVNCKTRQRDPFFVSDVEAYDGSVLAMFPRDQSLDLERVAIRLNQTDWHKLGFVCDGRYIFSQRSLSFSPCEL